jgi:hypothetical protein
VVRIIGTFAIIACFTLPSVADIPPPPPGIGFKRVPYEYIMILKTEIPGYKFYPFQQLGLGGQETVGDELKLGTKGGVAVSSSSSPSVRTGVVAAPVTVVEELETKENLAKLLSRDNKDKLPAGVVVYETHGTIRDLKTSDPRAKVENVITVSLDDVAGVKFTAKETPAPRDGAATRNDAAPVRIRPAMLIAGIAMAMAVAVLGVKYVGRA